MMPPLPLRGGSPEEAVAFSRHSLHYAKLTGLGGWDTGQQFFRLESEAAFPSPAPNDPILFVFGTFSRK